jgi:hypothetical protein
MKKPVQKYRMLKDKEIRKPLDQWVTPEGDWLNCVSSIGKGFKKDKDQPCRRPITPKPPKRKGGK